MKSLKSAILTTPKWAVVDISDFNYTKLSVKMWRASPTGSVKKFIKIRPAYLPFNFKVNMYLPLNLIVNTGLP